MEETLTHTINSLFAQIAIGNQTAFRQVFHYYNKQLYPFIFSIIKSEPDAREVMQEVFLKLWLHREELTKFENPAAWLKKVAVNTAYDSLRKTATYEMFLDKYGNIQATANNDACLQNIDLKDTRNLINEAVTQLPLRRKVIFQLAKMDGWSRKEIAEKLGISENTVRNQLGEAIAFVEDHLKKHMVLCAPLSILLITLS